MLTSYFDIQGVRFVASSGFLGRRTGFVFKLGHSGLGYYRDQKDESYKQMATNQSAHEEVTASQQAQEGDWLELPSIAVRENDEAIVVLIQVPFVTNISCRYTPTSATILFNGGDEQKDFGVQLDCAGDIVEEECSFDAAVKNMVAVLKKKRNDQNQPWIHSFSSSTEAVIASPVRRRSSPEKSTEDVNKNANKIGANERDTKVSLKDVIEKMGSFSVNHVFELD